MYMFPIGNAARATRAVSSGTGPVGLSCRDTIGSPLNAFEPTFHLDRLDRKTSPVSVGSQFATSVNLNTGPTKNKSMASDRVCGSSSRPQTPVDDADLWMRHTQSAAW